MQAYVIMAHNTRTGVTVQQQDLRGSHCTDLDMANLRAQTFAQQQTARTRDSWTAQLREYTVQSQ